MAFRLGLVLMISVASCIAYEGYPNVRPDQQLSYEPEYGHQDPRYRSNDNVDDNDGEEIPGVAGKDYPILREVPQTGFECEQYQYPGYYADPEAGCQAFHICQRGKIRKDSFLCPNGTLFNQERLVCEWWNNVDCSRAQSFYSINEAVAKVMEEADRSIQLANEKKLFRGYQQEPANDEVAVWNNYNQQSGQQQGWNKNVFRHNQNLGFTDEVPSSATTDLPVYGVPEISDKRSSDDSDRYGNSYLPPNYRITGAKFGREVQKNEFKQPTNVYLSA